MVVSSIIGQQKLIKFFFLLDRGFIFVVDDFFDNLTSLTSNLEDIAFTRYATIININNGTVDCKESNGTIHKNIRTASFLKYELNDTVILGFVDNNIYNPFIIGANDIDREGVITDNVESEISAFAYALAEAINPSS